MLQAAHSTRALALRRACRPRVYAAARARRWASSKADSDAQVKKKENLKEIRREIERGYFGDVSEFRKCEGKLFTAATDLIPANDSPVFPAMTGTTLAGRDVVFPRDLMGRTTLLCLGMRDFAQPQIQSFQKPFLAAFGTNSAMQAYQVSVIEKQVWRMLAPIIRMSLRKSIPEDLQDHFVQCTSSADVLKTELEIRNSLFGYCYLIDAKARVRWRACGTATDDELATMRDLARRLAAT